MSQRIITLTTDFGLGDHYAGAMKGVILGINPDVTIVDISHTVQSFDVLDAALTISQAYEHFPANTIHVVVVDPGVGTSRRPLLVSTGRHAFVAPDNGVLSLVYDQAERISARHITAEHYFLQPVSQTFHGRDIFSSVAGHLSKGVEFAKFGDEITDFVRFAAPRPKAAGSVLKGVVLRADKFGNLVTNFTPADVPQLLNASGAPFTIRVGKGVVSKMVSAYAECVPGEVFAIMGSMGFLEISCNRSSAAMLLGVGKGAEVEIMLEPGPNHQA